MCCEAFIIFLPQNTAQRAKHFVHAAKNQGCSLPSPPQHRMHDRLFILWCFSVHPVLRNLSCLCLSQSSWSNQSPDQACLFHSHQEQHSPKLLEKSVQNVLRKTKSSSCGRMFSEAQEVYEICMSIKQSKQTTGFAAQIQKPNIRCGAHLKCKYCLLSFFFIFSKGRIFFITTLKCKMNACGNALDI